MRFRWETFLQDLKHSLRMFAKSPAFTLAAVAALTLGIGATPPSSRSSTPSCCSRSRSRSRSPRDVHEHLAAGLGRGGVAGEVPALARADERRPGRRRLQRRRRQLHRRQLSRAAAVGAGLAPTSSGCSARRSLRGRTFTRGRRPPERRRRSPSSATASGQRRFGSDPRHHRQVDLAQRRSVHRRSASSARLRLRGVRPGAARSGSPFQLDPNTTDQGHYFQAAGPAEAGRHARAGARRG